MVWWSRPFSIVGEDPGRIKWWATLTHCGNCKILDCLRLWYQGNIPKLLILTCKSCIISVYWWWMTQVLEERRRQLIFHGCLCDVSDLWFVNNFLLIVKKLLHWRLILLCRLKPCSSHLACWSLLANNWIISKSCVFNLVFSILWHLILLLWGLLLLLVLFTNLTIKVWSDSFMLSCMLLYCSRVFHLLESDLVVIFIVTIYWYFLFIHCYFRSKFLVLRF